MAIPEEDFDALDIGDWYVDEIGDYDPGDDLIFLGFGHEVAGTGEGESEE